MLRGKSKFLKAMIIIGLAGTIGGTGILIFEAATPGAKSGEQSTAVGTQIASIINEHETNDKDVEPESVAIKNPIASLKIGETYLLETEVLPSDTTFPGLSYSSSEESVAKIDGDGLIHALGEGDTVITINNTHNNELSDSFALSVSPIPVEEIALSIQGETPDANGDYTLSTEQSSYRLQAVVSPDNATEKTVIYSLDRTDFISISGSTIRLLSPSGTEATTITASCGGISQSIRVFVEEYVPEVIPLTQVRFSVTSVSLGIGESKSVSLRYTPSGADEARMSAFTLSSENTAVATISSSGSIKGVAAGSTNVKATLKSDPSISASIPVTVSFIDLKPSASLSLRLSSRLRVSLSATASISGWNPSNATAKLMKYYRFFSSDSSIASVNETSGKVTAKAVGNTSIRADIYGSKADYQAKINPVRSISAPIEIFDSGQVVSFGLNTPFATENSDGTLLIHQGTEYNLSNLTHRDLEVNGSSEGVTIKLGYEIEWQSEEIEASIANKRLTVTGEQPGYVRIRATDENSGVSASVTFLAIKPLTYEKIGGEPLYVGESEQIVFDVQDGVTYEGRYEGDPEEFLSITNEFASSNTMTYEAFAPGSATFIVTPSYDGIALETEAAEIHLNAYHKIASDFVLSAHPSSGEPYAMDNEEPHRVVVGTKLDLRTAYTPFETPTSVAMSFRSSDSKLAQINGNQVKTAKVGLVTITAEEAVSGITHEIKFKIVNECVLDSTKPFTFKALGDTKVNKVENDADGNPVFLKSFSYKLTVKYAAGTTFRGARFHSEDESILTIGEMDGSISALAVGKTKILVDFDDGLEGSVDKHYSIDVSVRKRAVIENISSFNLFIRKLLGHFGAFLILGIATSMFFVLGFTKKQWWWSVPANLGYGFLLAPILNRPFLSVTQGCYRNTSTGRRTYRSLWARD